MTSNRSIFKDILDSKYANKILFFIMAAIILALITDTLLIRTDVFISKRHYGWNVSVFIVISFIYVTGQYIILEFIKHKTNIVGSKGTLQLRSVHKMVRVSQYTLTIIIVITILQILGSSYYDSGLLVAGIPISYTVAIILLGILARQFLLWLKSKRDLLVLLYGSACISLAISLTFTLAYVELIAYGLPKNIYPHAGVVLPFVVGGSLKDFLGSASIVSSVVSFIITWIATTIHLRHFSLRFGKIGYWIIFSIPMVYFLSQFITITLNLLNPFIRADLISSAITFNVIFTLSKPLGGILFGIAFWAIAKNISRNAAVKDYLILSAYGLTLIFVSDQATVLVTAPYPPFGLATTSFLGLSSYLMLTGIYSAAISVSHDIELRQSIRKLTLRETRLLNSIGTAHMQQEVKNRVETIIQAHKDTITEQSGIHSSFDEENIQAYIDEVLKEINNQRKTKRSNRTS